MAAFNIDETLQFAVDLAHSAGAIILAGASKREAMENVDWDAILKKNTADLVTETDQATERHVKEKIAERFPDHDFIGEESWAAGEEAKLGDKPTWIVDPIDGTTNFVKGFPFNCISIGVCYQQKVVIGVIYSPSLQTLYYASSGNGAFRLSPADGGSPRRLPLAKRPAPLPSLKMAVVAVEWGSDRKRETIEKKTRAFATLCGDAEAGVEGGRMVQGVRSLGSAALSMSCVAEGSIDMWQEIGCWAWDVCAGTCIVQEAGGVVLGSKADTLSSLSSPKFGEVTPQILQGRKYLVLRAIGDTDKESGSDAQRRIAAEFYNAIDDWEAA